MDAADFGRFAQRGTVVGPHPFAGHEDEPTREAFSAEGLNGVLPGDAAAQDHKGAPVFPAADGFGRAFGLGVLGDGNVHVVPLDAHREARQGVQAGRL